MFLVSIEVRLMLVNWIYFFELLIGLPLYEREVSNERINCLLLCKTVPREIHVYQKFTFRYIPTQLYVQSHVPRLTVH